MDQFEDFVKGITAELSSQLRGTQPRETASHALQAFLHAVDWREQWLVALVCFHVSLAAVALLTRRSDGVQAALFLFIRARRACLNARVPPASRAPPHRSGAGVPS